MRSRPDLTVLLSPPAPLPGEELHVEARFESHSDTPLDRVLVDLTGVETVRVNRGKTTATARHDHIRLRAEIPGKPLTVGTHSYHARFPLPARLPRPYRGRCVVIDYTLEVRADIPWWPDRVGRYEVPVAPAPVQAAHAPVVFVTDTAGVKSGELYVELALASATCVPGGVLEGTVAITNGKHEKGVSIALVASERLFADGGLWNGGAIHETHEVQRWELPLCKGPPQDGVGMKFRLRVPQEAVPSFEGFISALEWALEVTTPHLFSHHTVLRVPIQVVEQRDVERRPPAKSAPAVGRERHAQSFARVAERLRLRYDGDHDELRGDHGEVGLRIAVENRPDGTLATVAHLGWPSLGMRLSVKPSSWTDAFARGPVETGVAAFDKRFHAQSRFPDQARALLDTGVCALLASFEDVVVNDEGATLAVSRALVEEPALGEMAARVMEVARMMDAGMARIPLPPALAGSAEGWRALAASLGGRFEPGRGAVHEGTLGLERVEIVTQWDDRGEKATTVVRVPLDVRVDPETISPAARAQAASLGESAGGKVTVLEDAVTLAIEGALADVRALDAALEGMSRLVSAVRRREGASPFRS